MRLPSSTALFAAFVLAAVVPAAAQINQSGQLAAGDLRRDTGELYDPYTFNASANQRITIDMRSTEFDTYLIVRAPDGTEFTNDDFDGTERSFLDMIAPQAGVYSVLASAYDEGLSGRYTISIELGSIGRSVAVVQGQLAESDPMLPKGEYVDTHTIQLAPGSDYFVELTTDGYDGYLSVMSPSQHYTRNDDAGDTTISRVGALAGEFGNWTVYVTSLSEGETGNYTLRVYAFSSSGAFFPPPVNVTPPVTPPRPPRPVGGPPGPAGR